MPETNHRYPMTIVTEGELAAGGVVWRPGDKDEEVLLVHRPRYGDWTFPKGKVENGESLLECAVREVWEEAGAKGVIGRYLGSLSYRKPNRRSKEVHYWVMMAEEMAFVPSSEVDRIRWVPRQALVQEVSYSTDQAIADRLRRGWTAPPDRLLLNRHAIAGVRGEYGPDDRARPLSKRGRRQAVALVSRLACFDIDRVLSSLAVRCLETVAPLAHARGLVLEDAPGLWEESSPGELESLLDGRPAGTSLFCTHRLVVGEVLRRLMEDQGSELPMGKGSTWVFDFEDSRLAAANYLAPPG